ncbi:ATPase [Fusobacterium sp. PH5-44]|uniref:ATPase n=1 Tax=unclassified Fusobacterium TaxID=2648384 RepID=UPI003D213D49
MIEKISFNDETKIFLQNELKAHRNSGTYLFYGKDTSQLFEISLILAKGLCCPETEDDFCDACNTCNKINKLVYSDLDIIDTPNGIKVDTVRELIQKAATSPFEGNKKVFILKNIQNMKKEASNALLKLIEEPSKGNFFIMLTNSLNILPTIKSRSIIFNSKLKTSQELGISPAIYKFFRGNSGEIQKYKNLKLSLNAKVSFDKVGKFLKKYSEDGDFTSKVNVYLAIRDFIDNRIYISLHDKIFFAEEILRSGNTREIHKEMVSYAIDYMGYANGIEDRLMLKGFLRYPVNMKIALINLFTSL